MFHPRAPNAVSRSGSSRVRHLLNQWTATSEYTNRYMRNHKWCHERLASA